MLWVEGVTENVNFSIEETSGNLNARPQVRKRVCWQNLPPFVEAALRDLVTVGGVVVGDGKPLETNGNRLLDRGFGLELTVRAEGMHVKVVGMGATVGLDILPNLLKGLPISGCELR
jgi:hypothetical protein